MSLNFAIIGPGRIARNQLVPALEQVDGARLWSVLSRDYNRAVEFAEAHSARSSAPAYTELKNLVSDPELDAVIIATPDKLHAQETITCAQAGKHILVEKPMATNVEDAKAMVEACEDAGVRLGVAYHLHWHNGHRQLVERIRTGTLGVLRHMRVQWTFKSEDAGNWRAFPEVGRWWGIAAVGTHCLDFIRWIMVPSCGEVESIQSMISNKVWGSPHDETAILSMRFESGATAEFCSSVLIEAPLRAEVYGADGYAICDGTLGPHGAGTIHINGDEMTFKPENPYVGEIRDFVRAIEEGRAPEVDGKEGARNVELLVAATE